MAKTSNELDLPAIMPPLPADGREALQWFVSSFGLYVGSARGLFLHDFMEEHQAGLEASIINLKARGFNPLSVSGDMLYKQAEYMWEQAIAKPQYGRPLASKLELDLWSNDIVILQEMLAPENSRQLWYLYNYVIYPRALAGKATIITTPLSYDEFIRYGAGCPDVLFAGRPITWEKLIWRIEASMIPLQLFKSLREEGLPPMLKAEYLLFSALKERGLKVTPEQVLGDYMLDLALVEKDHKLDIEIDGAACLAGLERQSEEAKFNLLLLTGGWQILRFNTSEILQNARACADVVEEVWASGRKRTPLGRLLTGQGPAHIPDLPIDDDLQRAAIVHGDGPAALVGGAGTGKTTTLTHRIAYLLTQEVNPESILVINHSAETAQIVRQGLEQIAEKQLCQRLQQCLWSDIGQKILKENLAELKRKPPLKVEPNPQKVLQRLLAKHKKELDPLTLELSAEIDEFTLSAIISFYKANLVTPKQVKEQAKDDVEELIARVYQAYEEQLQKSNRVDKDDLISLAVQLLLDQPAIRAKYQYMYEYVLVDEYQDVTLAQDMLARLLASPQDNLYLAGDENESILESKGAAPKLLSEISFRMPQTRCYSLEKNWRSHPAIVDHAQQLLNGLSRRRIKIDMASAYAPTPSQAIVGPHRLANEKAESEWVADEIQLLADSGRELAEIAVLYRYHRYANVIEDALLRKGVRFRASRPEAGLVPDELEDTLAFLRLVMDPDGPRAKEAFERVCQLRAKEVDPKLSQTIASFAEANNLSYLKAVEIYSEATADQSCRELEQLVRIIRTMHQEKLPPAETISLLRRTQRLNEYYRSVHVPPGVYYEPLRKLSQLEDDARKFQTVADFVKHQQALKQQQLGGQDDGVRVLSLHESKGREFAVVFLVGLADGLLPEEGAPDLDEERRLCYVGFSRAKEMLYLSYPGMFGNRILEPSSYLVEARLMPQPSPRIANAAATEAPAPMLAAPARIEIGQAAAPLHSGQTTPGQQAALAAKAALPATAPAPAARTQIASHGAPPMVSQVPANVRSPAVSSQTAQGARPPVLSQAPVGQAHAGAMPPAAQQDVARGDFPGRSDPGDGSSIMVAGAPAAHGAASIAAAGKSSQSAPASESSGQFSGQASAASPAGSDAASLTARQGAQSALPLRREALPAAGSNAADGGVAGGSTEVTLPGTNQASAPALERSRLEPEQSMQVQPTSTGSGASAANPPYPAPLPPRTLSAPAERPPSVPYVQPDRPSPQQLPPARGDSSRPSHGKDFSWASVSQLRSTKPQPPQTVPFDASPVQPMARPPSCPGCSAKLEGNARFCGECGYSLGVRIPACPTCSAPVEGNGKFCGECGSRIDPPTRSGSISHLREQEASGTWVSKIVKLLE